MGKDVMDDRPEIELWQTRLRDLCNEALRKSYKVAGILRSDGPVHYYVLEAGNSNETVGVICD